MWYKLFPFWDNYILQANSNDTPWFLGHITPCLHVLCAGAFASTPQAASNSHMRCLGHTRQGSSNGYVQAPWLARGRVAAMAVCRLLGLREPRRLQQQCAAAFPHTMLYARDSYFWMHCITWGNVPIHSSCRCAALQVIYEACVRTWSQADTCPLCMLQYINEVYTDFNTCKMVLVHIISCNGFNSKIYPCI